MGPELSGPFNKCKCFMVCGAKCSMLHVMWSMVGVDHSTSSFYGSCSCFSVGFKGFFPRLKISHEHFAH